MERLNVKALFALTFLSLALNIVVLASRRAAADPPPTPAQAVGTYQVSCAQSIAGTICYVIDTRTGKKFADF